MMRFTKRESDRYINKIIEAAENLLLSELPDCAARKCLEIELAQSIRNYKQHPNDPKLQKTLNWIEDWHKAKELRDSDLDKLNTMLEGLTWSEETYEVIETAIDQTRIMLDEDYHSWYFDPDLITKTQRKSLIFSSNPQSI